jgi:hypothetical protein
MAGLRCTGVRCADTKVRQVVGGICSHKQLAVSQPGVVSAVEGQGARWPRLMIRTKPLAAVGGFER